MSTFAQYLESLNEALITFGGKANPKFGQIVILAGGAGSGKGFQIKHLMGIEGRILDPDQLKQFAVANERVRQRVKEKTGHNIENFNLKNPENVSMLHSIVKRIGIEDKRDSVLFQSIMTAHPDRKPNIIVDTTLSSSGKLRRLADQYSSLGYAPENIHLVWVATKLSIAKKANKSRSRVVPEDILVQTHQDSFESITHIIDNIKQISRYANGDYWISFRLDETADIFDRTSDDEGRTSSIFTGKHSEKGKRVSGKGMAVSRGKALYFKIKDQGSSKITTAQVEKHIERVRDGLVA